MRARHAPLRAGSSKVFASAGLLKHILRSLEGMANQTLLAGPEKFPAAGLQVCHILPKEFMCRTPSAAEAHLSSYKPSK